MAESTITFLITGGAVVLFVWNRLPVGIVALAVALSLYATGILTVDQALSGFGDPTVVFIAALFVVSEALDATGVTTWAGQQLTARVGTSRTRLLVSMMLLCAVLTAVISVNGAVAALIPMVVVLAVRLGRSPAQLLMPLAFAAHAGSLLLLTGTPVNIIISETAADAGCPAHRVRRIRLGRCALGDRHDRDRGAVRREAAARPHRGRDATGSEQAGDHTGQGVHHPQRPHPVAGGGGISFRRGTP